MRPYRHVLVFAILAACVPAAAVARGADIAADAHGPVPGSKGSPAFAVARSAITGGGGTSTGGSFVIQGSIGQPDADPLQPSTGGAYAITGGFWRARESGPIEPLIFADGFEVTAP